MSTVQANFLIPEELLATLRALVPRGKQSAVVANALKNELRRIQFNKSYRRIIWSVGKRRTSGTAKRDRVLY